MPACLDQPPQPQPQLGAQPQLDSQQQSQQLLQHERHLCSQPNRWQWWPQPQPHESQQLLQQELQPQLASQPQLGAAQPQLGAAQPQLGAAQQVDSQPQLLQQLSQQRLQHLCSQPNKWHRWPQPHESQQLLQQELQPQLASQPQLGAAQPQLGAQPQLDSQPQDG